MTEDRICFEQLLRDLYFHWRITVTSMLRMALNVQQGGVNWTTKRLQALAKGVANMKCRASQFCRVQGYGIEVGDCDL